MCAWVTRIRQAKGEERVRSGRKWSFCPLLLFFFSSLIPRFRCPVSYVQVLTPFVSVCLLVISLSPSSSHSPFPSVFAGKVPLLSLSFSLFSCSRSFARMRIQSNIFAALMLPLLLLCVWTWMKGEKESREKGHHIQKSFRLLPPYSLFLCVCFFFFFFLHDFVDARCSLVSCITDYQRQRKEEEGWRKEAERIREWGIEAKLADSASAVVVVVIALHDQATHSRLVIIAGSRRFSLSFPSFFRFTRSLAKVSLYPHTHRENAILPSSLSPFSLLSFSHSLTIRCLVQRVRDSERGKGKKRKMIAWFFCGQRRRGNG